ncbi:MAG TPA: ATP-binding protein, partial [Isosphaeraceae bacterium]|nr:ATP-binding protein [Isosphaeraceae bacterium]
FRHLVEAAECLILILRADHSIVYFSPFAERLTGYSLAEVRGRDYFEVFMPETERPAAIEEFRRIVQGHQTHGYQATNLSRDGSKRWIVWNVRLLPSYEDEPAILAVGQDITSLREAQTRALQSERLAAIGQMMAGLAHESRNALQRSQACLEMLAIKVQDRPDALDLIARIQNAQDHLHHLYEDVRGYASPILLERRESNLRDIWQEAWTHLEPASQTRKAVLHEQIAGVNLVASVDPFRLAQVFRNLFENALAACPPPVEITVSAREATLDGHGALLLSVLDNGPGIPPDQAGKLFEPFFTTKTKGTGLGLSIARRIIEEHGGSLQNNPSTTGAEFLITLPRETPS